MNPLPHDIEVEKALLGSILIDPQGALPVVADTVYPDAFYLEAHRRIFEAVVTLFEAGNPVDRVMVTSVLEQERHLKMVGGSPYLIGLMKESVIATRADRYAERVLTLASLRDLIRAGYDIVQSAHDMPADGSIDELLDEAGERIHRLTTNARVGGGSESAGTVIDRALERLEQRRGQNGALTGLPTGFGDLDRQLGGLQGGRLYVLAARPGMGKSALMLDLCRAATKPGAAAAIFSLEMSAEDLMTRMLCAEKRLNHSEISTMADSRGYPLPDVIQRHVIEAAGALRSRSIEINDNGYISVAQLRAEARRLHARGELDVLFVDYIQLMESDSRGSSDNRNLEISRISRGLKLIARELDVPVVALSQLSRAVETRPNKRPMLSDLRDSGSIEQDADVVMFLYRDSYYNPESDALDELIVAKNRHGALGTIYLKFANASATFGSGLLEAA